MIALPLHAIFTPKYVAVERVEGIKHHADVPALRPCFAQSPAGTKIHIKQMSGGRRLRSPNKIEILRTYEDKDGYI